MGRKYLALSLVMVMLLSMFSITSIADTGSTWTTNKDGIIQNGNVEYTDIDSVYFKTSGLSGTDMYVYVRSQGNNIVINSSGIPARFHDKTNIDEDYNYHLVDYLNKAELDKITLKTPYHIEIVQILQSTGAKSDMFKIVGKSSLLLTKAVTETSVRLGDTVHYTLTIKNDGNVDLTGIVVHDPMMVVDVPAFSLIAGASTTIQYTYVIKDTDRPSVAGEKILYNTATATGGSITVSATKSVIVTNPAAPGLSIDKSALETDVISGGAIHYKLVVTNTGNIALTGIRVTDTKWIADEIIERLEAGNSKTYNYIYLVQSSDVPSAGTNGSIVNTAAAIVVVGNEVFRDEDSVTVGVTNQARSSINVTKTANKDDGYAGDIVTYTVDVKNTGNVPLTNVTMTDSMKTPVQSFVTLFPNETKTWEYELALTADLSRKNMNTVTAAGIYVPVGGQSVFVDDTAIKIVNLNMPANIEIQKRVVPAERQNYPSETTSLAMIPMISLGGYQFTLTGPSYIQTRTTDVTGAAIFSGLREGTYTLTEAAVFGYENSLPAGGMVLHVDKDGKVSTSDKILIVNPITVTNTEKANPVMTIDKQVSDAAPLVNSTITYTIVLKNEGNVTMHNIVLEDNRKGPLTLLVASLAPNQTTSVRYTELITTMAQIVNVATAAGLSYSGEGSISYRPISDTVTVNPRTSNPTPPPTLAPTPTSTPVPTLVPTPTPTPVPALEPIPEVVISPEPLPEAVPEIIVDTPEETPQAAPILPKTGGLPLLSLIFMGSGLVGGGLFIRKRK